MSWKVGSISIRDRHIWFIYFLVMQCFYVNTYVQLFAQLFVLAYVLGSVVLRRLKITNRNHMKAIAGYLSWYGLFCLVVILSQRWAYGVNPESKTVITVVRVFAMGLAMILYMDSRKKVMVLLKSMIHAAVIMGILALITTPISMYGQASSEGFGTALGYHRNFYGYYMGICAVISYYLACYENYKYGKQIGCFFIGVCLCTGSRGGLLQLCLICGMLIILEKNIAKKTRYILAGILFGIVALSILCSMPYFREVYIQRILSALHLNHIEDASAKGRNAYRIIAWKMFEERPIQGFGLDGFICYLADNPMIAGYHLDAVYSHCNLVELLANFGIIGFSLYYSMHIQVIVSSFIRQELDVWCKLAFVLMVVIVIMDYYGITYQTHLFIYLYVILYSICRTSSKAKKVQS